MISPSADPRPVDSEAARSQASAKSSDVSRKAERARHEAAADVLAGLARDRQLEIVDRRRTVQRQPGEDSPVDPIDQIRSATGLDDVTAQCGDDRVPGTGGATIASHSRRSAPADRPGKGIEPIRQTRARRAGRPRLASETLLGRCSSGSIAESSEVEVERGKRLPIFDRPVPAHSNSFSRGSFRNRPERSRARRSSMISCPAMISSPIRKARSGAGPSEPAQLDRILLCGQGEIVPTAAAQPSSERPSPAVYAWWSGNTRKSINPPHKRQQCAAKPFRVADPAERRTGRPRELRAKTIALVVDQIAAAHAAPQPSGAARPCARPAALIARRVRSRRSSRPATGRPPRGAATIESARGASPWGRAGPARTGSRASSNTTSRSRAQPAMLKSIVQHDQLRLELPDGNRRASATRSGF